ncbi:SDR family oxidoreductase [Amycolatopsis japonica]
MNISLVTGATRGIGFEIARRLGGVVLLGARDEERGNKAEAALRGEGFDARFVRLDVTDPASIVDAVAWIDGKFGRLDVLVNNAGAPIVDWNVAPSALSLEDVRQVYEVNLFGVIAVTNAMLPLLRESGAGRIVNISSRLGSLTSMSDPDSAVGRVNLLAYNSSKAALNSVTIAYAKELRGTPIKVNAVNPGFCDTDMATEIVDAMGGPGSPGLKTAAEGAAPAVIAATLPADGPTGTFFGDGGTVPW